MLETLVRVLAPRNRVDYVGKAIVFLMAIGSLNYLRDHLLGDGLPDSYVNNFSEAVFVGAPFVLLALALVGYLRRLQVQLAELAATDVLTGLANRRAFIEYANGRARSGGPDTLLMIDVDHFKRINDRFGHDVGDICLQEVAQMIARRIRRGDFLARMGGEEFAVLLEATDAAEACPIADRIARGGHVTIENRKERLHITLSVGMAETPCATMPIEMLLKRADAALYKAKADGRACVRLAQASVTD